MFRLIDANINRTKEGLRVVEDICRYILNDKDFSYRIKSIRHKVVINNFSYILKFRDIQNDVSKNSFKKELIRESILDILESNFRRCFEALRVLEEFFKLKELKNYGYSDTFKNIRYELYGLHKEIVIKYF